MANGKSDFRLLTGFAIRSSLISSLKPLNLSRNTAMHQDSRKKNHRSIYLTYDLTFRASKINNELRIEKSPFAWWRYCTPKTKMLCQNPFVFKFVFSLGSKETIGNISLSTEATNSILVLVVKWRHDANALLFI